jgi:hypothetical protein
MLSRALYDRYAQYLPDVDKLLDQQRQSSDQSERTTALRKAEQIYVVDDPSRPVSELRRLSATNERESPGAHPVRAITELVTRDS